MAYFYSIYFIKIQIFKRNIRKNLNDVYFIIKSNIFENLSLEQKDVSLYHNRLVKMIQVFYQKF